MSKCAVCKIDIVGQCLICNSCFKSWPKGLNFGEYCKQPYKPEPVKIPPGFGTAEDFPE